MNLNPEGRRMEGKFSDYNFWIHSLNDHQIAHDRPGGTTVLCGSCLRLNPQFNQMETTYTLYIYNFSNGSKFTTIIAIFITF